MSPSTQDAINKYQKMVRTARVIATASFAIGIMAIIIATVALYLAFANRLTTTASNLTTTVVNQSGTLAGINQPLNATQLSVINNGPDSYYEKAGEMYLNGTLGNSVGYNMQGFNEGNTTSLIVNGKPSVIYLGSITCIFCGENRWAMALALSRFGKFNALYKGYSALKDGDVPTLYWTPTSYNTSTVNLGSSYSSSYVNFIAIEDTAPITGGFVLQPLSVISQEVNSSGNSTYISAFAKIMKLNNFLGTPYTIWSNYQFGGADAVVFGNTTAQNAAGQFGINQMGHSGVFKLLSSPTSQFAISEYAAADVYGAAICPSINNSTSFCKLPAIQKIETQIVTKAVKV